MRKQLRKKRIRHQGLKHTITPILRMERLLVVRGRILGQVVIRIMAHRAMVLSLPIKVQAQEHILRVLVAIVVVLPVNIIRVQSHRIVAVLALAVHRKKQVLKETIREVRLGLAIALILVRQVLGLVADLIQARKVVRLEAGVVEVLRPINNPV